MAQESLHPSGLQEVEEAETSDVRAVDAAKAENDEVVEGSDAQAVKDVEDRREAMRIRIEESMRSAKQMNDFLREEGRV